MRRQDGGSPYGRDKRGRSRGGRGGIAREEVVRAGVGRGYVWPKIASLSGGAGFGKLSASFNPDRGNQ